MADTGQEYAGSGESSLEAPYDDNAWTDPGNVTADDGNTANVTAANFDTNDYTEVLKAYNFDMSAVPVGATIDGVICRVNAWQANGGGDLVLMQLLDTARAKGGTNQCAVPVSLTADDTTVITKGGAADTWGLALTEAWVKDSDFGVALVVQATEDNCDCFVDYVTLQVYYTEGDVTVTPGVASVVGSAVSPAVVLGSHSFSPGVALGVASAVSPAVVLGSHSFTPGVALAVASAINPVVVQNVVVTPGVAAAVAELLLGAVVLGSHSFTPGEVLAIAEAINPGVVISAGGLEALVRALNLRTLGAGGRR